MNQVPYITFAQLLEQFDVILFDSDGVLVRWPSAIPHAPEAIARLNALDKPYFVLTNDASQVAETRAARYAQLGLAIDPDKIISSGMLLKAWFKEHGLQGARCVVLGTEDSIKYVRDAGGQVVPFNEGFDVLVVGDQDGFPFLDATRAVLTTLFRHLDRGRHSPPGSPQPRPLLPGKGRLRFRQRQRRRYVRVRPEPAATPTAPTSPSPAWANPTPPCSRKSSAAPPPATWQ